MPTDLKRTTNISKQKRDSTTIVKSHNNRIDRPIRQSFKLENHTFDPDINFKIQQQTFIEFGSSRNT